MNAVPFVKKPKFEDISKYREKIPCYDRAESIIAEEVAKGNKIVHMGDAGFSRSETIVVIDIQRMLPISLKKLAEHIRNGKPYRI